MTDNSLDQQTNLEFGVFFAVSLKWTAWLLYKRCWCLWTDHFEKPFWVVSILLLFTSSIFLLWSITTIHPPFLSCLLYLHLLCLFTSPFFWLPSCHSCPYLASALITPPSLIFSIRDALIAIFMADTDFLIVWPAEVTVPSHSDKHLRSVYWCIQDSYCERQKRKSFCTVLQLTCVENIKLPTLSLYPTEPLCVECILSSK